MMRTKTRRRGRACSRLRDFRKLAGTCAFALAGATLAGTAPTTGSLSAQEVTRTAELPADLVESVLAFVNDPATIRFDGDATIPPTRSIDGPLALVGGILTVEGTVRGDVVVLNGDLVLGEMASVAGDVLIVGGDLDGEREGAVQGMLAVYERPLPVVVRRDGLLERRGELRRERPGLYVGGSRFSIRAGTGYNRVEGLPIRVGPVIRSGGEHPFRFDAAATFRTESGLSVDDLGYLVRMEQLFGGGPRGRVGASAYSEIQHIEERGLSDLESSLSTFLFRRDPRDYFQNEGWNVYLGVEGLEHPVDFQLTYRSEDHYSVSEGSPWTLFRNEGTWRPLPLVGEGRFESLEAAFELDNRNNPENPSDGWYLRASLTRGLSGTVTVPSYQVSPTGPAVAPTAYETGVTSARIDLRRHLRIDPNSDLRLRAVLAGSLAEETLAPQLQSALGGEGTLPGQSRFAVDCGARDQAFLVAEDDAFRSVYPRYGCDRTALFQIEYRNELDFEIDLSPDDEDEWDQWTWWPRVDLSAAWLLFLNAGRGWSFAPDGYDTDTLADVGLGFFIGEIGLYWAYPLNGSDNNGNFFVRLQHRF